MTRLFRILMVAVLACLAATSAGAQTASGASFTRLTIEQGLSQSTVTCIAQDNQGFLWFGTGDGLSRYDGYTFKNFRRSINDPKSLSGNLIYSLYADPDGSLWVGTSDSGLSHFDPRTESFTRYLNDPKDPQSLNANTVYAMVRDGSGKLWVATKKGISLLDTSTGKFEQFEPDPAKPGSLGGFKVVGLVVDSRGILWVGHDKGLDRFDPATRTFTHHETAPGPDNAPVSFAECTGLFIGKNGLLYYGTAANGFIRFDPSTGRATQFRNDPAKPESVSAGKIFAICEDHLNRIWIGSYSNGLDRLESDDRTFTHFRLNPSDPESIGGNKVWAILEDRSGGLWVGVETGGANRLSLVEPKFRRYLSTTGNGGNLNHINVWGFSKGPGGQYLVGTDEGLFSFDPVKGVTTPVKAVGTPPVPIGAKVGGMFFDRRGTTWIGTDDFLARWDTTTGKVEKLTTAPGLPPDALKSAMWLREDRFGRLWIGCGEVGGVAVFDPDAKTWKFIRAEGTGPAGIHNDPVPFSFAEDGDKGVWLGFHNGLFRYDYGTEKLTRFPETTADDSIREVTAISLLVDKKGRLWATFEGAGLSLFNRSTGTFKTYTMRDGLPNDVVYDILEDVDGKLWLTTNSGLSRFDPDKGEFRNFDSRDGLQSNEFNSSAAYKSSDGLFFVGGINGFNVFNPSNIRENELLPPVAITGFKIAGDANARVLSDSLLQLDYRQNNFSFDFAALNFNQPEKCKYAYRLEGYDTEWIQSGTRRFASYTNLGPGDYTFQVRATNEDGVWNEKGTAIRLRIAPPPWATWWAYCIYATLFAGGIAAIFGLQSKWVRDQAALNEARLRAEAAEQLALQNEELDRKNKELAQVNEDLVASQRQADRIFSALAEALPGTTLDGKYRLEEKIGAGGFGVVFRGMHLALNRNIAVKVFKPIAHNDSAEAIERFKREGVSASRLNHPNIVTVLDSGVSEEGIAYIVMELLRGFSLKDELFKVLRLSVERSLRISIQISNALAEAHRAGIIHRDIKPENIFMNITPDGEVVKVVDFGVAKMIGAGSEMFDGKLTMTGGLIGTPVYMAPERLEGNQFDGRSDVYSLGVTLYEMLCGRPPFRTSEGNLWQIVLGHLKETPPPLRKYAPNVPVEVEMLVLKALAKNPMSRPTAKEFFIELTTLAEQLKAIGFTGDPDELAASPEPHPDLDEESQPTYSTRKFQGSVDRGLLPTESLSLDIPGDTPTLGSGESWSLSDLTRFPDVEDGGDARRPSLS